MRNILDVENALQQFVPCKRNYFIGQKTKNYEMIQQGSVSTAVLILRMTMTS